MRRAETIIVCWGFFSKPCNQQDNEAITSLSVVLHEVSSLSAHLFDVLSLVYSVKHSEHPSPNNHIPSKVASASKTPRDVCLHMVIKARARKQETNTMFLKNTHLTLQSQQS